MIPKPVQSTSKASSIRPVRKSLKGAAETMRMFLNVDEVARRPQTVSLSRYVE